MILRPAQPQDAAQIAAIWNQIIRDTVITFNPVEKTDSDIEDLIRDRAAAGHGFVVASAPQVVGFATYGQFRGGAGYARSMEHSVHLAASARGRGLGGRLMDWTETHARSAGAHVMIGVITAQNMGSIRFHAARGYREVGRIPEVGWKFGTYHEAVFMAKYL